MRKEHTVQYPSWAQFIGAMITMSSMLCIPTVLILRLIIYHRARKQMKEFWKLTLTRARNAIENFKMYAHNFRRWVYPAHSWTPPPREDESIILTENGTPYFHADDEPPTPSDYQSETSVDSDENDTKQDRKD